MKNLLVIGAGNTQLVGIQVARDMGFAVIAVDANPQAAGLRIADRSIVADIRDANAILEAIRGERLDGVCAFSVEAAVKSVAAIAEALGLPGLSRRAAENATNKQRMRECWGAAGVPSPRSMACSRVAEALAAAEQIGFPLVVKPADSAGSRGVSLVKNAGALAPAFAEAQKYATAGVVLVETFMAGVEMSVEGFMVGGRFHGLACSDKIRTEPPYLLDTTVLFPSEQPAEIRERAVEIVAQAATALELDNAPVHAEVMVTPVGPMMVELAARGPGFKVFSGMLPWVTGVDVVRELIRLSLGEPVSFVQPKTRGAVLRFPDVRPGRVTRIGGMEEARRTQGVAEVEVYCQVGDSVRALASGADRVGHIIALAETREGAEAAVRTAEAELTIETSAA
jgi:biotin carboxylase